jgi:hypothetical protein
MALATLRRSPAASLTFLCGATACAASIGYLSVENRLLAVLTTVAVLVLAVTAGNAAWLAVVAMAGVWITKRAPGLNVSFTDLLVVAAGVMAWAAGVGRTLRPGGRILLRSFAIYLGALGVTLAYNQSLRSDFEWFHRVGMVAGAVFMGAWLVRAGLHHSALRALLAVTVLISVFAVVDSVSSGFAPAQPFGYQKNFIGSITTTVLLVVLAAYKEFRMPVRWLRIAAVLMAAGLVASQSRGAMLAFAVGALIWWFRRSSKSSPRLRSLALVSAVALALVVGVSVKNQLQTQGTPTSLTLRFRETRTTRQLWIDHPFTGVGLRFFKTPAYAGYAPPTDVFNEILAEAGILGLVGFLVFVTGSLVGLSRVQGELATAALCVVSARFVHGLFDIYWTGGTTPLPWIVAGMALAPLSLQLRPGPREPRPRGAAG